MTDISFLARKIILFLRDKFKNEDISGLQVNDIIRKIDENEDLILKAIEELSGAELIRQEWEDTVELTVAGFDYDLLSDGSIAEDVLRNGME